MATKPEFLVAKEEMLVALATVSVSISSPGLWDGAYGLSTLSEKTGKSNRLQMSLQR